MEFLITNKIYKNDCLEILPLIPDKTFDCIITDAPYGLNYQSVNKEHKKIINDDCLFLPLNELLRITKDDGSLALFYSHKIPIINENIKQIIYWVKSNHTRGNFDSNFANIVECIAFIPKPAFKMKRFATNVIKCSTDSSNQYIHPTQKPLDLISSLILSLTNENDLILDCFSGSGSISIASLINNRNFIGIEIDENHYDNSINRLNLFNHLLEKRNNSKIELLKKDTELELKIKKIINDSEGLLDYEQAKKVIMQSSDIYKSSILNKR